MYEKVTEVLKRQYTYFDAVNLFYNGNWLYDIIYFSSISLITPPKKAHMIWKILYHPYQMSHMIRPYLFLLTVHYNNFIIIKFCKKIKKSSFQHGKLVKRTSLTSHCTSRKHVWNPFVNRDTKLDPDVEAQRRNSANCSLPNL